MTSEYRRHGRALKSGVQAAAALNVLMEGL